LEGLPLLIRVFLVCSGAVCLAAAELLPADHAARMERGLAEFQKEVRSILSENCVGCHGGEKTKGGLNLATREGLLKGGTEGAVVVPFKASESRLLKLVRHEEEPHMPEKKPALSGAAIKALVDWIDHGAPYEGSLIAGVVAAKKETATVSEDAKKLWAFQPVREVEPPKFRGVAHPVDQFILAKATEKGLAISKVADRRTLIRRAAYDLTGLPPTVEEIAAFVNDRAPDAFERMIGRFLDSPHYGERWGRWWLDVARYADSNGQDENKVMANAWRYRDWVVRSFNANQRFDAFITEQLAGDLLPAAGASEREIFDRWTATGFLVLGPKMLAEQDKAKLVMDLVDEQIDVVSRAFLGLTVACARCHDHKFDPIPARDYYAMAGIFKSTKTMENLAFVSKFNERRVTPKEQLAKIEAFEKAIAATANELKSAIRLANRELVESLGILFGPEAGMAAPKEMRSAYRLPSLLKIEELEKRREELIASAPGPREFALSVEEDKVADLPVHLRGSHLNPTKDPVPRGFIQAAMRGPMAPAPANKSGRLELAQWLTSRENPLTARVMVNRIWQAHFGEGLVRTPENFGVRGETPSHPELLDWLAREFIRSGWDVKALHRLILTSATWKQGAAGDSRASKRAAMVDPENRLLWHFPRQRLEAEIIRDALLAVSGRLDETMGGTLVAWKNDEYTPADTVSEKSARRSIYLPVVRDRVYAPFTIFDFANPSVGVSKRTPTVVSHQALFFMNSPLVKDCAAALAKSLIAGAPMDSKTRVKMAYERAFGRLPTDAETRRALQFIASDSATEEGDRELKAWSAWCQILFAANEFVYRE